VYWKPIRFGLHTELDYLFVWSECGYHCLNWRVRIKQEPILLGSLHVWKAALYFGDNTWCLPMMLQPSRALICVAKRGRVVAFWTVRVRPDTFWKQTQNWNLLVHRFQNLRVYRLCVIHSVPSRQAVGKAYQAFKEESCWFRMWKIATRILKSNMDVLK